MASRNKVNVVLTEELKEKIREYAAQENRSMSNYIFKVVAEHVQRREAEEAKEENNE